VVTDGRLEIINLLADNESRIGRLYSAYAEKFPEYYNFWILLASEEEAHSQWIKDLHGDVLKGSLFFDSERFDVKAIKLFADYLEQKSVELKEKDFDLKKALGIAFDIENALIESRWFEIYKTDQPSLRFSLKRLQDATNNHKQKLAEAILAAQK